MKKIFGSLTIVLALLMVVVSGCKEKPLPEATLYPNATGLSGKSKVYSNLPYQYRVDDMTGATYEWNVTQVDTIGSTNVVDGQIVAATTIEQVYDYTTSVVNITFGQPAQPEGYVMITVTQKVPSGETDADTMWVAVAPFCPPADLTAFVGTDIDAQGDTVGFETSVDAGFNLVTEKVYVNAMQGTDGKIRIYFYGPLAKTFTAWDDNQSPEIDTIDVVFALDNPNFTIDEQLYAHTVEGGDNWFYYFSLGEGSYEYCSDTMKVTINFDIHYISDDAGYNGYFYNGYPGFELYFEIVGSAKGGKAIPAEIRPVTPPANKSLR